MSVKSNVERAEESIRKALINALAEGEDHHLTELFEMVRVFDIVRVPLNVKSLVNVVISLSEPRGV